MRETHYHEETPDRVRQILESERHSGNRIRVFYGDSETGRDWHEENDVMGYVGRSTGIKPIPLLIHNSRSLGGGAILDHCIIKITRDKRVLYMHPEYYHGKHEVRDSDMHEYREMVLRDGEIVARFKEQGQAYKWVCFIEGRKNSK